MSGRSGSKSSSPAARILVYTMHVTSLLPCGVDCGTTGAEPVLSKFDRLLNARSEEWLDCSNSDVGDLEVDFWGEEEGGDSTENLPESSGSGGLVTSV